MNKEKKENDIKKKASEERSEELPKKDLLRYHTFRMVSVGVVDEPINQAYDVISTVALIVNLLDHVLECVIETPVTIAHYTGMWNGSIYGYAHTMEDHIVARLQTAEAEKFIEGLEFAGAHQISGDGMGPAVTNGRKAAKNVLDDIRKKKEAAAK